MVPKGCAACGLLAYPLFDQQDPTPLFHLATRTEEIRIDQLGSAWKTESMVTPVFQASNHLQRFRLPGNVEGTCVGELNP